MVGSITTPQEGIHAICLNVVVGLGNIHRLNDVWSSYRYLCETLLCYHFSYIASVPTLHIASAVDKIFFNLNKHFVTYGFASNSVMTDQL